MFSEISKEKKYWLCLPSVKTIYYWLRTNTGEEVVSVLKYNKLKRKNKELKRLVGELTLGMSLGKKLS